MKFLVDAQLPPMLATWLSKHGYDALHVQDKDLRDADDTTIRSYIQQTGSILITKDRDFIPVQDSRDPITQVIWVRTGNMGTRALIDRFEAVLPQLLAHLKEGARLVELR